MSVGGALIGAVVIRVAVVTAAIIRAKLIGYSVVGASTLVEPTGYEFLEALTKLSDKRLLKEFDEIVEHEPQYINEFAKDKTSAVIGLYKWSNEKIARLCRITQDAPNGHKRTRISRDKDGFRQDVVMSSISSSPSGFMYHIYEKKKEHVLKEFRRDLEKCVFIPRENGAVDFELPYLTWGYSYEFLLEITEDEGYNGCKLSLVSRLPNHMRLIMRMEPINNQ